MAETEKGKLNKLGEVLAKRVPPQDYSLEGYFEDNICLEYADEIWLVYYANRSRKDNLKTFKDLDDAAKCIIERLLWTEGESAVKDAIKEYESM